MGVSREAIENRIVIKLTTLSEMMAQEFGGDSAQWLGVIQKTKLYSNLLNIKTHMWSEGDMYLWDYLIGELKEGGIIK